MPTAEDNPLHHPRYTRSNGYDAGWVFANQMGPNALWLMEALADVVELEPGMRVLDLGCGTAMTSIFLAKEFGVRVCATDLWIDATSNLTRIREAGVDDLVVPIHAEAHDLPFADGYFDAIVSVDAYHYFGTADLYLGYVTRFLRDGGQIGIVAPAVLEEIGSDPPTELAPYWEGDYCCFHSPEWWRAHWARTQRVRVDVADAIEDGWKDWLRFDELSEPHPDGWRKAAARRSAEMLRVDQGKLLGFTRIVGTKVQT
jgi:SAM-dependent methyltransferase